MAETTVPDSVINGKLDKFVHAEFDNHKPPYKQFSTDQVNEIVGLATLVLKFEAANNPNGSARLLLTGHDEDFDAGIKSDDVREILNNTFESATSNVLEGKRADAPRPPEKVRKKLADLDLDNLQYDANLTAAVAKNSKVPSSGHGLA